MNKIKRYFITGLVVILPVALTGYILYWLFKFTNGLLGKYINAYLANLYGIHIPGLGLIISILIIIFIGFITSFISKQTLHLIERSILKVPLIRQIYPAIKQLIHSIISEEKSSFKKVVLVEYPRRGIWSLGFVTNEGFKKINEKINQNVLTILIPTTPTPLSGFTIFVPRNEVIFLDLTLEEGLKIIISGGLIQP